MKEEETKHLEFIQSIINRMANNAFMLKGWSISLLTGLFALSIVTENKYLAFLPIVPVLAFWGLDAYYLRQERLFRKLYDAARKDYLSKSSTFELFCMDTKPFNSNVDCWFVLVWSKTILLFHGIIFFVVIVIGIYFFLAVNV